jgi:hypothetical protein
MNKQTLMNLIRTAALAALAAIPGMCCSYSVSVPAIPASGGVMPVYVSTQAGCPWQVTHSAGWMSNYGGQAGAGPGVVYVYASPDYSAARSVPVHVVVTNAGSGTIGGRSGPTSYIAATTTAVQY